MRRSYIKKGISFVLAGIMGLSGNIVHAEPNDSIGGNVGPLDILNNRRQENIKYRLGLLRLCLQDIKRIIGYLKAIEKDSSGLFDKLFDIRNRYYEKINSLGQGVSDIENYKILCNNWLKDIMKNMDSGLLTVAKRIRTNGQFLMAVFRNRSREEFDDLFRVFQLSRIKKSEMINYLIVVNDFMIEIFKYENNREDFSIVDASSLLVHCAAFSEKTDSLVKRLELLKEYVNMDEQVLIRSF